MSIHQELKAAGVKLDHHETDLYALKCPESDDIVARYKFRTSVTTFRSQVDGQLWYEIPFAFEVTTCPS